MPREISRTGARCAAAEVTGRHGDRYIYSVWRRSEYIVWFPVRAILDSLSEAEGIAPGHPGWGGAGSPRPHGSRLSPVEVEAVVATVVARARTR